MSDILLGLDKRVRFRSGLPLELLYADDLALEAESKEELLEKFQIWRTGLEAKGLKVDINKTKILHWTD